MKQAYIPLSGGQHAAGHIEQAGPGAAGADIDADDIFSAGL